MSVGVFPPFVRVMRSPHARCCQGDAFNFRLLHHIPLDTCSHSLTSLIFFSFLSVTYWNYQKDPTTNGLKKENF